MKKQILMMALCVSTLMPVTVFGEEAAVQNVSTVNKEETASGDENPKIEESGVTAVNDTVTVAIDADILDYPGKKRETLSAKSWKGMRSAVQALSRMPGAVSFLKMKQAKCRQATFLPLIWKAMERIQVQRRVQRLA